MKRRNKRNPVDNEAATIESTTLQPGINIGSTALDKKKADEAAIKKA